MMCAPTPQSSKGTPSDKLRLALVFLLAAEQAPSDADVKELSRALSAAGADTTALLYVQRLRRNHLVGGSHSHAAPSATGKCLFPQQDINSKIS